MTVFYRIFKENKKSLKNIKKVLAINVYLW